MAITDTNGIDASIAPKNVLRLDTSEIKAISIADISIFTILYIIIMVNPAWLIVMHYDNIIAVESTAYHLHIL